MKLSLPSDHVEFDFPNALELFKFDDDSKQSKYYHGLSHCMKAVDVIGVFDKFQVWVEIKLFPDNVQTEFKNNPNKSGTKKQKGLTDYINDIKIKYKDTYLYRLCENEIGKPVYYIFLTNLTDDLCNICQTSICQTLPCGNPIPKRWKKELLKKEFFQVVNLDVWNTNYNDIFGTCVKI